MGRLPEGEYIAEATSPTGQYTVKAYVTNGGATTSYAVRGELNFKQKEKAEKYLLAIQNRFSFDQMVR